MDNYILVKLDCDCADEFNINSFWVTTVEEYNRFLKAAAEHDFAGEEFYFGTNECMVFHSTDHFLSSISSERISEEYYNALLDSFGDDYGILSIPGIWESIDPEFNPEDDDE